MPSDGSPDEYIKREDAIRCIREIASIVGFENPAVAINSAVVAIERVPASDVAPVRHGRWIERRIPHTGTRVFVCSACGGKPERMKRTPCPNCGARMDK